MLQEDARVYYGASDEVFEVTLHEPRPPVADVPEAMVQALWQRQQFNRSGLKTTAGETVTVLDPGRLNTDSGPDFVGSRILIGGQEWQGAIEVHLRSGQWLVHRHGLDPAYRSVVLHVALFEDEATGTLKRADESLLPELMLYPYLDTALRELLFQFHTRDAVDIPCATGWPLVPQKQRMEWIEHLARERLQEKKNRLAAVYLQMPQLEKLLHHSLFAGLGYAKNTEAMTTLAARISLEKVRLLNDPFDIEALHFGVAGLLPPPSALLKTDRKTADYVIALHDRFAQLQAKLDCKPMDASAWRFFRLRPANFPTVRIAQAARLVSPRGLLREDPVGKITRAMQDQEAVQTLRTLLSATPGDFWKTHVRLEKVTTARDPSLGLSRRDALIANALVPLLLLVAEQTGNIPLEQATTAILAHLPAERDEVTRRFIDLGTTPKNTFISQGMHQLYRSWCANKRCLDCPIGINLMKGILPLP